MLDGEQLKVSYLAEITQRTGEDWPEVTLVLSTARQGLRQTLPELSPWYIGRPQPPRPVAMRARRRAARSHADGRRILAEGAFGRVGRRGQAADGVRGGIASRGQGTRR